MSAEAAEQPTEADAIEIAEARLGQRPEAVRRFPTGIGHWVYEVQSARGEAAVVRLGTPDQSLDFEGALHWSSTLRPIGVPLPRLIAHGTHRGLPYLVLERLAGDDLGLVYGSLTTAERRAIATEICAIQQTVGGLPEGASYGFLRLPSGRGHASWGGVIEASLARSRARIEAAGLVSVDPVERVAARSRRFESYFSRVRATAFLDDATTKNVLVSGGRLSGIVDVDWLCFGDPLFTVALTRTALLSSGQDPEYTDHWCQLLALTEEQHEVLRFYTALFCVDFMSELGQRFNRTEAVGLERLQRLEEVLNDHLGLAAINAALRETEGERR